MQDKTILYNNHVDTFFKRLIKVLYPHILIPSIFIFLPFFNNNPYNMVTIIWMTIMLSIIVMMLISSYKWTFNQVASLAYDGNFFEIEIVIKNARKNFKFEKNSLSTTLKWQGGRPRILKLSLFNNGSRIADFYSGGIQKLEHELEGIAYKINKNKTPADKHNDESPI